MVACQLCHINRLHKDDALIRLLWRDKMYLTHHELESMTIVVIIIIIIMVVVIIIIITILSCLQILIILLVC